MKLWKEKKIKWWIYLVPTISSEFTVWPSDNFGSALTLTIDGRIRIVFGGSCKFWYRKWKVFKIQLNKKEKKKKEETTSNQKIQN